MSEATQRRPAPDGLRKAVPLLALLAVLATWFGWSGVRQWRDEHSAIALEQARDAAVAQTSQALAAATQRFAAQLRQSGVQSALARGDAATAAQALREGWKDAEDAQVLPGDLGAGYADVDRFGYGRLALLEKALLSDAVASAVVRDGGGPRLDWRRRWRWTPGRASPICACRCAS